MRFVAEMKPPPPQMAESKQGGLGGGALGSKL
jgi:hypothetical protein